MAGENNIALLIDADNVSDRYIKIILDELSKDGTVTYKRIYGDFTRPNLGAWKGTLLAHSITPVQQYGYTTGKNATDSAMIIDAMDILYSGHVQGFCLVSSDSDFTRLASRLRESGMMVIGMGEKKTPQAFIAACNKFKYLDILSKAEAAASPPSAPAPRPESAAQNTPAARTADDIQKAVVAIVSENSDEDDWVYIGDIGNILIKRFPDFDVRNYGFKKLTPFIGSFDVFDMKTVRAKDSGGKQIYVKMKNGNS